MKPGMRVLYSQAGEEFMDQSVKNCKTNIRGPWKYRTVRSVRVARVWVYVTTEALSVVRVRKGTELDVAE